MYASGCPSLAMGSQPVNSVIIQGMAWQVLLPSGEDAYSISKDSYTQHIIRSIIMNIYTFILSL